MKCECCRKREATLKDYRTIDGIHGKVFVCGDCFNLNDSWFGRTMNKAIRESNFIDDEEKMYDFTRITKNEFLKSYSYITRTEYDNTKKIYDRIKKQ